MTKRIAQDTVICEWIKAEQESERFKHYFAATPNLLDPTMHPEERLERLQKIRKGFPRRFPWHFVDWQEYTISSKEELGRLRTHKGINWLALSGGSRLIRDAASIISSQDSSLDPHLHIKGIMATIDTEQELPKLIGFLPTSEFPAPILLEGHARAVAYHLSTTTKYPLTLYVATSTTDRLVQWDNGLNLQEIRDNFLRYGRER